MAKIGYGRSKTHNERHRVTIYPGYITGGEGARCRVLDVGCRVVRVRYGTILGTVPGTVPALYLALSLPLPGLLRTLRICTHPTRCSARTCRPPWHPAPRVHHLATGTPAVNIARTHHPCRHCRRHHWAHSWLHPWTDSLSSSPGPLLGPVITR